MEINPCNRCTLKEGYGGDARCSMCELSRLREENQQLKKKLDRMKIERKRGEKI